MFRRLALAAVLLLSTVEYALAAWGDFRVGTFAGLWCNYPAYFEIQSREENAWVFHGRIRIISTGQYDVFRVEQFRDLSVLMTRFLAGPNAGQTQWVQSSPPWQSYRDGPLNSYFTASSAGGIACNTDMSSYIIIPE